MRGSNSESTRETLTRCPLGGQAAMRSQLGAGQQLGAGSRHPTGRAGPSQRLPPGWSSRLELQPLVPRFHKGELVHRSSLQATAAGIQGPAPSGRLPSPASCPEGGMGGQPRGPVQAGPLLVYPPEEPREARDKASRGKGRTLEPAGRGAHSRAVMDWPHDLGSVASLGPWFPYL